MCRTTGDHSSTRIEPDGRRGSMTRGEPGGLSERADPAIVAMGSVVAGEPWPRRGRISPTFGAEDERGRPRAAGETKVLAEAGTRRSLTAFVSRAAKGGNGPYLSPAAARALRTQTPCQRPADALRFSRCGASPGRRGRGPGTAASPKLLAQFARGLFFPRRPASRRGRCSGRGRRRGRGEKIAYVRMALFEGAGCHGFVAEERLDFGQLKGGPRVHGGPRRFFGRRFRLRHRAPACGDRGPDRPSSGAWAEIQIGRRHHPVRPRGAGRGRAIRPAPLEAGSVGQPSIPSERGRVRPC